MQTLYIPDKIQIELLDKQGRSLHQDKILIGIKIDANFKNNIDLSPFLSDKNGIIIITSEDIKKRYDIFVSYGLMDYSSLESAKPEIQLYYWGNNSINKYINYWTKLLDNKNDLKQFEMWGEKLGKSDIESALIEKKERQEFELFTTCYNRSVKQLDDSTIIRDSWDKKKVEINYKVKLDLKQNGSR